MGSLTPWEVDMSQPASNRTEFFLRYTRSLTFLCLFGLLPVLFYGAITVWDHDGHYERLQFGLLVLCPVILTFGLAWIMFSRRGVAITNDDPDLQAVAKDEFRRRNALRAFRVAFATVLALQFPLAWLLSIRPNPDGIMHLATFTWFIGFISFLSAFLFFDRD